MENNEIDKKIQQVKENIKKHTLKQVQLDNSLQYNTPNQIEQHKAKKDKNRKKNKLQKKSRKNNR